MKRIKRVLVCLLCLCLLLSLFVFSASAESTTYDVQRLSTSRVKVFSDQWYQWTADFLQDSGKDRIWKVTDGKAFTKLDFLLYDPTGLPVFKLTENSTLYTLHTTISINEGTRWGTDGELEALVLPNESSKGFTANVVKTLGYNTITYDITWTVSSSDIQEIHRIYYKFSFNKPALRTQIIQSPITVSWQSNSDKIVGGVGDKIDEQTEAQKGMFEKLGETLLNGIKNLFIPSNDFFQSYLAEMNTWLSDHFGALYYPIDLFIDICGRLLNLSVPDNPSITLPTIQVGETVLLASQTYSFDMSALPALGNIHSFYLTVVDVIIAIWLCGLAGHKLKSILGG